MTFVSSGAKETKTEWPVEEGLEFGTTKQQDDWVLEPTEASYISDDEQRRLG